MGEIVPLSATPGPLRAPEILGLQHSLAGFESGEPVLDDWLQRRAFTNQLRNAARTYVVCEGSVVIGYYCLAAGALIREEAIPALRRNMPDPVPAMILGRLAVRRERAGMGVGSGMLSNAIHRTLHVAETVGFACLLVHALHDRASEWYLARGFRRSPVSRRTLMLPVAEMQANLPR